jgi:Ca2+-binding EF-hand superfamily protein
VKKNKEKMSRQLTREEIVAVFNAIDTSGDGKICANELSKALGEKNFSKDEINLMVSHLDADGDRLLSLQGE